MRDLNYDCVVVGGGHAGFCAAHAASQSGCSRVLIVDKCPEDWAGGNGYFTAGAFRTVHYGLQNLLPIVCNVPPELTEKIDMDPYSVDDFSNDIMRLGDRRSDPALVQAVVQSSRDSIAWLAEYVGVRFILSFNRQAYEVDGRQKFWGGMVLSVEDGGKGLIQDHRQKAKEEGIEVWFNSPATELIVEGGEVVGVIVERNGEGVRIAAHGVVLAAGGFEANRELRRQHLGPEWAEARVRGTPYNTGDGFTLARAVHARTLGDWAGCHSTAWDASAPADAGSRTLSNQYTKSGYPLGLMVNANGERFVDEGEDLRNYTYARFGRRILQQAGGVAWQVWDGKVLGLLRKEEYGDDVVRKIVAGSIEELADKLCEDGVQDRASLLSTIRQYNSAVAAHRRETPNARFNPAIKDALCTQSSTRKLDLPKSNWAQTIDKPPFVAVKVSCGITFTFGGLAIDPASAAVINEKGEVIKGLYCTGEMVGGLFFGNYPGGSGLTAGAVFGRKAGTDVAGRVVAKR